MNRPRSRRDFLLDSGGVTTLSKNRDLLLDYLRMLEIQFDGAFLLPTPILGEIHTGDRRIDVITDRLLKAIGGSDAELEPVAATWRRAGELRTEALQHSRNPISTGDAVIVALAEERSVRAGVTIITGDKKDMDLLVGLTRRPNIAVDVL